MSAYIRILPFALLALVSAQGAPGSKVVPHSRREKLLTETARFMNFQDAAMADQLVVARYPFEFEPPKEVAPELLTEPEKIPDKVYTDEEILNAVAPLIRPSGAVVRDGKGILILPQGPLPDGSVVKLNFQGKPYLIKVMDVVSDSYKLKLNESVIVRSFDPSAKSGRVSRD